ncbi:hypothetical protein cgR_0181 [Corynebacterium glutamicum R]|uniref:Uncharacterized protein n=2 Tax=Corynebacterium glutamicum TaxID=1718 RepID=A0AB72V797_CORGB|nr:hypothetical protein cgR_0181 [Corynebacterium glutamicum R]
MVARTATGEKVVPTSPLAQWWAMRWEWFKRTGLQVTGAVLEG